MASTTATTRFAWDEVIEADKTEVRATIRLLPPYIALVKIVKLPEAAKV